MGNIAVNWYEEAQKYYNKCISTEVAFVDENHENYAENKILEMYHERKGIPTVSDILNSIYNFNRENLERGFVIELKYNPEFAEIRDSINSGRLYLDEIISEHMEQSGFYDLYNFILKTLGKYNLQVEMFDADDFQFSGEIWAEDIYGKGASIVVNDCQEVLLCKYCSFGKELEALTSQFTPGFTKRMRIVYTLPFYEHFARLEASK